MKLIFCSQCGVVLNQDAIYFPDIYGHDSQQVIEKNAVWDNNLDRYVSKIDCPVCGATITKEG
jgi:hypothetical protein